MADMGGSHGVAAVRRGLAGEAAQQLDISTAQTVECTAEGRRTNTLLVYIGEVGPRELQEASPTLGKERCLAVTCLNGEDDMSPPLDAR